MQKARRHHRSGSDRLRAHGFRSCFTPLFAVLFTFPSRYLCAIGLPGVLSLGGWCRLLRTGLLRPRPTQGPGWVGAHSGYGPQGPRPRRRRATRRLIMQKARRHHLRGSDRLWAHGFRYSFTPLLGVLFTFPSRYLCAIGLPGVLSLGGWCRQIRTGLLRPRPTQGSGLVGDRFAYGAVTRYGPPFQACSATVASSVLPALQPRARLDARGLGSSPFARRYSGSHCCFPFLRLLGCFGSSGSPPP